MDPELTERVEAARAGDRDAFAYVATALAPAALDLARRVLRDRQAAEDAVQEGFLTALGRLEQLERPEAFPGWLLAIVRTSALKQERRRRPDLLGADAPPVADPGASPAARAARAEAGALVRQAVRALPPRELAVIERYYLAGVAVSEIARELGVPPGTVKRRLHEARDRLRPRLLGLAPRGGRAPAPGPRRRGLRTPL